jgi:hypothetical protein
MTAAGMTTPRLPAETRDGSRSPRTKTASLVAGLPRRAEASRRSPPTLFTQTTLNDEGSAAPPSLQPRRTGVPIGCSVGLASCGTHRPGRHRHCDRLRPERVQLRRDHFEVERVFSTRFRDRRRGGRRDHDVAGRHALGGGLGEQPGHVDDDQGGEPRRGFSRTQVKICWACLSGGKTG